MFVPNNQSHDSDMPMRPIDLLGKSREGTMQMAADTFAKPVTFSGDDEASDFGNPLKNSSMAASGGYVLHSYQPIRQTNAQPLRKSPQRQEPDEFENVEGVDNQNLQEEAENFAQEAPESQKSPEQFLNETDKFSPNTLQTNVENNQAALSRDQEINNNLNGSDLLTEPISSNRLLK